jgi:hypothetical protein
MHSLRPDLGIEIEAPDGRLARLVIEVKQVVERRGVSRLGEQVRRMATSSADVSVVAARYLSESVREALTEDGLSYVDVTGDTRIVVNSPAVFILERSEDRDPWRKGRPRGRPATSASQFRRIGFLPINRELP